MRGAPDLNGHLHDGCLRNPDTLDLAGHVSKLGLDGRAVAELLHASSLP